MKILKHFALLLLSVFIAHSTLGQVNTVDSLKQELKQNNNDSSQCKIYLELCKRYALNNQDSALFYLKKAQIIAISNSKNANHGLHQMGDSLRNKGNFYYFKNSFEEAITYYLLASNCYENLIGISKGEIAQKANEALAKLFVNMGVTYTTLGNLDKALEKYYNALKVYDQVNDNGGMASCYLGIGNIHYYQNELNESITYLKKGLELYSKIGNIRGMANCNNSLGSIYYAQKDYDKANQYFGNLLVLKIEQKDKKGISTAYTNLANVCIEKENYELALEYLNKSLSIDQELGDTYSIAIVESNIARLYFETAKKELSGSQKQKQIIAEALLRSRKALKIANELNVIPLINSISELLIRINKMLGDYPEAIKFYDLFNSTKDSLFSEEKTRIIAEMQTKYESEKKQQEIDHQKLTIEKKETENKRQRMQRNFLIICTILLLLLVFMTYRSYRQKNKSNALITEKNAELEQANEEIMAQKDEIESQRDMVIDQKDRLEAAHNNITDSLRYAQSIQAAILPSEKILKKLSSDYFIMMKPCELVGGDFFWATTFDEFQIFCITDCTGHGVPGAFMSVLGITALNDIISKHRSTNPSEILGQLRQMVIETLGQNNPEHFHKDGMDIALCVINTKTRELHYAGAGIPIWIVLPENTVLKDFSLDPNSISQNGFSLHQVKADIMPIGYSLRSDLFANKVIKLPETKIAIYISTDGFSDQLNPNNGKKYSTKRLKQLILQNADKPFNYQHQMLEQDFIMWMNSGNQTDDITVLGIRI